MTAKVYRAGCPECGREIGAATVGQVSKPGSVKLLRHKAGGPDWCPGSGVLVEEFVEVETAEKAKARPRGRDGGSSQAVCWTCHQPIDPSDYWRAIWPGLPAGAFVSICGPECPELGEARPYERTGGPA